jgi:hypothetical protein
MVKEERHVLLNAKFFHILSLSFFIVCIFILILFEFRKYIKFKSDHEYVILFIQRHNINKNCFRKQKRSFIKVEKKTKEIRCLTVQHRNDVTTIDTIIM